MKLKLKNFRCHIDKEFDFGDEGLVLISGQSGCGKSTIMMAVIFVLYGNGTKITSFGKTTCEVEMTYQNLKIRRTKKPNRLTVLITDTNTEYEDDSAQSIINEKFGNAFDTTSYVSQNVLNSFIVMSPVDKLAFLEKFAFNGIDLGQIKSRSQSVIRKRNEELISVSSQLEMATEFFKTITKPEKVSFPIKTKNIEKTIENEKIRLSNTKILLKKNQRQIELLKNELVDTKIYLNYTSVQRDSEKKLKAEYLDLETKKQMINYIGNDKLKQYEQTLEKILKKREYFILKNNIEQNEKKLQEIKLEEDSVREKEIQNITNSLWKEYSEEELTQNISEYKQCKTDIDRFKNLKKQSDDIIADSIKLQQDKNLLEKYRIDMQNHLDILKKIQESEKEYDCPSCGEILKLQDGQLVLSEAKYVNIEITFEQCQKKINELDKIIKKLQYTIIDSENNLKRKAELQIEIEKIEKQYEELPDEKEIETSLDYLKEYRRYQLELEKRKRELQTNGKYSSTYYTFLQQLQKDRDKLGAIEKSIQIENTDNINEEELRAVIIQGKQDKEKLETYINAMSKIQKELDKLSLEIERTEKDFTSKYKTNRSVEEIEGEIEKFLQKEKELVEKESVHSKNMNLIEKYLKYKTESKNYLEWKTKIKNLQKEEEKLRKKYSASMLLKDKILEAESLAIQNMVNSINIHAQEYLDIFFPNDPIIVRLSTFKVSKKNINKPQINLEIDYKGNQSDISALSGGELARVVLAFTLSLSEIFNSPIVMLDESTASLDQEMTSIVMDGIRKNFSHKLVLTIAHQVISGEFDRQVNLNP